MSVYNFSAGPGVMPVEVTNQIQRDLPSYKDSGMSVMEISHRSSLYTELELEAEQDLRDLMKISDDYAVLFLQGGGTLQFTSVPLNLATHYHKAVYLNSGYFSKKAIEAANRIDELTVQVIENSDPTSKLPKIDGHIDNVDYVYLTTNNTIEGTAYHQIPKFDQSLVVDMSSNILAEPYNVNDFDLIFAGAQKNIGPAGMTVVIVKRDKLVKQQLLSDVMDYRIEDNKHSAFNTPPVFNTYAAGLTFKWLKKMGGVEAIYQQNLEQADMLYDFIDNSKVFNNDVPAAERSITNAVFKTASSELDQEFINQAAAHGLVNLGGHRLVGGMRASLYNAMPTDGVVKLIDELKQFEVTHGGK
ncbi:3-phosphoserine phosphohydroxythreonine aminotransferase [Paucilactobacillus oligofermentans DSM 15707 = LMG 22743]|uniref:Phosphoserine aminotransferase n=1 Tax=Paucilactobacillus oligofermentans DSM 15707 = LMG 22743 TaxID=1423778 RepID=A0A0R1REP2_9LACO|nr:3-phosphoserine/phosphohydroxythreonine transaminase [Paucilactobacillus oligofermentans]KRL55351.1 3-phosphoserine phosphohydroxythreonine aminotransferase [Paucilactobacillus oligofermentans DSM 15707 = LMG 22743]CUS25658.1 Putative phosphoserine transaminase [Paucilactobacillus oligofermentans DSM 15707 = LMG 22743]